MSKDKQLIVSHFSAGVSSAVATNIAINKFKNVKVIYIHIDDKHPDTMRFVKECEKWLGVEIEILQSEWKNVNDACRKIGFINSPMGAGCTRILKKRVRKEWEKKNPGRHTYIWGFDEKEINRAERVKETMVDYDHVFPLIEDRIDKVLAHTIMEKVGIKRPAMYDLGYPNNNCVGCVKGGMGYWGKIRKDFPEVFQQRCELEEVIGARIFRDFDLKDLEEDRGRMKSIEVPDCGIFCEVIDYKKEWVE